MRWSALALLVAAGTASAAPNHGRVESTTSRWSGDMILTDVVVRAAGGTRTTIVEHGGSVDGIGMVVSHRDATLRPGDEVEIIIDRDGPRAQRTSRGVTSPSAATGDGGAGLQRTARSGRALYHPTGCLSFTYDAAGAARVAGAWTAFDAAFAAWETASVAHACGGVRFHAAPEENAPDGRDGVNTIHVRDTTWCRPASGTDPEVCHSPSAVAVTRVLYVDDPTSPRDGEILEVDIEVNAVDFTFANDGRAGAIDLQSAAAHEIGHALGLDHNCGVEGGAWPTDRDGTPVPSCESVRPELVDATMYVQVQPGSMTMRSPKPSDLGGLCSVVAESCAIEVTGGCSAGGGSAGLGVLLASLFVRRRRRA